MGKLVSTYWPKFAALRLFVETMPIYKTVATGKGKNKFYAPERPFMHLTV
jgi:hypothetical protein